MECQFARNFLILTRRLGRSNGYGNQMVSFPKAFGSDSNLQLLLLKVSPTPRRTGARARMGRYSTSSTLRCTRSSMSERLSEVRMGIRWWLWKHPERMTFIPALSANIAVTLMISSRNGSSGYPRTSRSQTRETSPYHPLTSTTFTLFVMQTSTLSSRGFSKVQSRCSNAYYRIYVDLSCRCESRPSCLEGSIITNSKVRRVCG